MMGLEEHLLGMFREDFEFHEGAAPSHLGRHSPTPAPPSASTSTSADEIAPQLHDAPQLMPMHADAIVLEAAPPEVAVHQSQGHPSQAAMQAAMQAEAMPTPVYQGPASWIHEAELELKKIPFFVRGKARRNTERYALEKGLSTITVETLYDAKAHFGR
jgi:light-independent protochlorophyllide reductase subunit B